MSDAPPPLRSMSGTMADLAEEIAGGTGHWHGGVWHYNDYHCNRETVPPPEIQGYTPPDDDEETDEP